MRITAVVLDNLRSAQNVGSILRTCDGYGVRTVFCCGITPYPLLLSDKRLPHIARAASIRIAKTSLQAERYLEVRHYRSTLQAIRIIRKRFSLIVALENSPDATELRSLSSADQREAALIVGHEIKGISSDVLAESDQIVHIKMMGRKKSFNVSVALAIALERLSSSQIVDS